MLSPVKKKQKSNDCTSSSDSSCVVAWGSSKNIVSNKSHKVLLPPKATISQPPQHPVIQKYASIPHGLSLADLLRIDSLKKTELISELDTLDGEYHKSWTKPVLVDTLLRTYASMHQPETAIDELVAKANNKIDHEIDDDVMKIDAPMGCAASTNKNAHSTNLDIARVKSTDESNKRQLEKQTVMLNAKNVLTDENDCGSDDSMSVSSIPAQHSENKETNLPVVQHPQIFDEDIGVGGIAKVVGDMQQLHQVLSSDSDETVYLSAREKWTQSQSQHGHQNATSITNTLVLTKQHHHSNKNVTKSAYETSSSLMHFDKQKQPPRKSPTTVPAGIVDSAKKLLLSSQKTKHQQFQYSNVKQQQPIGRVLYREQQTCTTASHTTSTTTQGIVHSGQPADQQNMLLQFPSTIFPGDLASSSTTTSSNSSTNRILSTPAYSSNGSSSGMSQKFQASKEARQAHVARMKEKVCFWVHYSY